MKTIEAIVIGGGQAGLAMSYCLNQKGIEHVILEQAPQAGHAWRDMRWDSFYLLTPNWSLLLPGFEYNGPEPDRFISRAEIIAMLEQYASRYSMPVQYDTRVGAVIPLEDGGYHVLTDQGDWRAQDVIVAPGFFQRPKRSPVQGLLSPHILQLHCSTDRNPEQLPQGGVLVVGSGQSGCQIAEELLESGREVWLSVGSTGRVPRQYRGRDIMVWLNMSGFFDRTPEMLASPKLRFASNPHLSGTHGGHSLNLHLFARSGMHLIGHVLAGEGDRLQLADDLENSLHVSDAVETQVVQAIDAFITAQHISAPEENLPQYRDGFQQAGLTEMDLDAQGIRTIIWANGFDFDYSMVRLPVTDSYGFPITRDGITDFPGLYFIGMPFVSKMKSGLFLGVGEDAHRISSHIAGRHAP